MNARALLITPWRCGQPSLRWVSTAMLGLCAAGAIAYGWFSSQTDWAVTSALILCIGLIYLWIFQFPNAFLLAMDARNLRVPGVGATVVASLALYAVLSVLPATLLLALFGANALNTATILLLCVLIGLAFALLPRYLAVWIGFMPAVSTGLHRYITIPGPGSAAFPHWALPLCLVLLVIVAMRWRGLLRAENPRLRGLSSAVVMRFRQQQGGFSNLWGDSCSSQDSVRNRPDWMQSGVDLRRVDPAHTVRALRVAIGNLYVPRTLVGHLRNHGLKVLGFLLLFPLMLLILNGGGDSNASTALKGFCIGVIGALGVFGPLMLINMGSYQLRSHWSRPNTELPLLALLPGLGARDAVKRDLLRATLGLPMAMLAVLLALVLGAAWSLGLHGLDLVAIGMSQAGSAVVLLALVLDVMSGHPLRVWVLRLLFFIQVLLVTASLFVPLTQLGEPAISRAPILVPLTLAAWAVFLPVMALLGWRGWQRCRRRVHAFLPQDTFSH